MKGILFTAICLKNYALFIVDKVNAASTSCDIINKGEGHVNDEWVFNNSGGNLLSKLKNC
jgi:hypothetical protein